MAYTLGTFVSILSLTVIRPLSFAMPAASKFKASVSVLLPTATSTFSASKGCTLPPISTFTFAPTAAASTDCTFASVIIFTPFASISLRSCAVSSPSIMGSSLGAASTTVTSVPNLEYAVASSIPITPPPMTRRLFGISSKDKAPVESTQFAFSFTPGMGGTAGTEPAAMMILSNVMFSFVPSFFRTARVSLDAKDAVPSTT